MGSILSGVFGSAQNQQQQTQVDPISQALNKVRLEQLQGLFGTQPLANFAGPNANLTAPSQAVLDLYSALGQRDIATAPAGQVNYSNLMNFGDYQKLGLDAAQNYISQIARPQIMSAAALQGQEGSGAVPEALAKATASTALPFVQSLPGASATLFGAAPQAELANAQRQLIGTQALAIPSQVGAVNAQRAATLFPLADYSRALQQEEYGRQQQVMLAGLTGLPFTPSTTTQSKTASPPLFGFFGQG